MPLFTWLAFTLLVAAFSSLWVKREVRIWGTLAGLSIIFGMLGGHITWIGLLFIILLTLLWFLYDKSQNALIFIALICLGMAYKLHLLPGYQSFFITPKLAIGLQTPLIGLLPLALVVPLATLRDWKAVFRGFILGCAGIALLALLATFSGSVHWNYKLPSHMDVRLFSNFFLTCIPEEGFYRGFIQQTLCDYFKNTKVGNVIALILTSLLFAGSHIYWSPNVGILAFTFLAGLLYGSVYLYSKKIESAILCHFLLNFIHMTFFSYHAM